MEGDEDVPARFQSEFAPGLQRARRIDVREERVDHRVADELDLLFGNALAYEVLIRALRVREQERRELIGDAAVVLLGQVPLEAAQTRLDVAHANPDFDRRQRAGE